MEILKKGFSINYDVHEMGLISPGGAGVIKETGYEYKASLKIKTQNVIQIQHEEMGLQDKEELMEFRILCDTNSEATELGKLFRALKSNGIIIQFDGQLPKYSDRSDYLQVTVFNTPQQLMQKYHDLMKPKAVENETKKSS